jgi:hypothetical protein
MEFASQKGSQVPKLPIGEGVRLVLVLRRRGVGIDQQHLAGDPWSMSHVTLAKPEAFDRMDSGWRADESFLTFLLMKSWFSLLLNVRFPGSTV